MFFLKIIMYVYVEMWKKQSICDRALCVVLPTGSSEKVDRVMDQVEKYIMTRLYKSVFCPETTDDEKKDLATQHRIR